MAQITYDDKVALNVNSDIADINKCNASDMNEIKNTINGIDAGTDVVSNLVVGSIRTKNMFDKDSVVKGSYISDTGSINTNASAFYGNYIPVEPSTDYIYSGRTNGWQTEALYDSSKNFISRATGDSFTTTANTYYVRTIGAVVNLDNIQLEKGSTATAYTPYQNLNPDINNITTRLGIPSADSEKYRGLYIKSNKTNTNTFVFDVPEFIEVNGTIRNIICVLGDIGMFSAYYTQAGSTQILGTSFRTSTTVSLSYSNGQITITSSNTAYGGCTVLFIN